jgi:hypothetical protein
MVHENNIGGKENGEKNICKGKEGMEISPFMEKLRKLRRMLVLISAISSGGCIAKSVESGPNFVSSDVSENDKNTTRDVLEKFRLGIEKFVLEVDVVSVVKRQEKMEEEYKSFIDTEATANFDNISENDLVLLRNKRSELELSFLDFFIGNELVFKQIVDSCDKVLIYIKNTKELFSSEGHNFNEKEIGQFNLLEKEVRGKRIKALNGIINAIIMQTEIKK